MRKRHWGCQTAAGRKGKISFLCWRRRGSRVQPLREDYGGFKSDHQTWTPSWATRTEEPSWLAVRELTKSQSKRAKCNYGFWCTVTRQSGESLSAAADRADYYYHRVLNYCNYWAAETMGGADRCWSARGTKPAADSLLNSSFFSQPELKGCCYCVYSLSLTDFPEKTSRENSDWKQCCG